MKNIIETPRENIMHEPDRPLGTLSTFVVSQMPQRLEAILLEQFDGARLLAEGEELAAEALSRISGIMMNPQKRDLAGLDAKMLETAIVYTGHVPGAHVARLVDICSRETHIPPGITYEDLILINPLQSDPRTFTGGVVGESEKNFYLGHSVIEQKFPNIIHLCSQTIMLLSEEGRLGVDGASRLLRQATEEFVEIIDTTRSIGMDMSKEHFAVFRKYLNGNPQRGMLGPSGKFTAGIPTLDFLLGGSAMEGEYPKLTSELSYYPRVGREDIQRARQIAQDGYSLSDITHALGNPNGLYESVEGLSAMIRQFRGMHYKAVAHQIPEALADGMTGTGGEQSPGAFLRQRQKIHHLGRKGSI